MSFNNILSLNRCNPFELSEIGVIFYHFKHKKSIINMN